MTDRACPAKKAAASMEAIRYYDQEEVEGPRGQ